MNTIVLLQNIFLIACIVVSSLLATSGEDKGDRFIGLICAFMFFGALIHNI